MLVYSITNTITGEMYIGQTTQSLESRMRNHVSACNSGRTTKLYVAMRKYGVDKFKSEVIAYAESKDVLDELEAYYIQKYDTVRHGYNMGLGGKINVMCSDEVAEKHDRIMRSDEVRSKISNSMRQSYIDRGGMTDEHRKHLSDNKKEFYQSDRGRAAIEKFRNSFTLTDEHKAALVMSLQKGVACFDESGNMITEFDSVKSAAEWFISHGCTAHSVKSACRLIKRSNDLNIIVCGYRFVYRVKRLPKAKHPHAQK